MSPFSHTGRSRLYYRKDQHHEQAAELAARLVELGVPESAILGVGLEADDGSPSIQNEILADARAGRLEILVVCNLDQISDDAVELSRTLIQLENADVMVISIAEQFCSDASITNQLFPTTIQHKEQ